MGVKCCRLAYQIGEIMALTIKKKNGLYIPAGTSLGGMLPYTGTTIEPEAELIEKVIKSLIKGAVGVTTRTAMKKVVFTPIYKQVKNEKEIASFYLLYKTRNRQCTITCSSIEATGVTLVEFYDYLISSGSKVITDAEKALEIV